MTAKTESWLDPFVTWPIHRRYTQNILGEHTYFSQVGL